MPVTLFTHPEGLFGCALPPDSAGSPLRPGGIELTGELLDAAGYRPGSLVVDIGCGEGMSVDLMLKRGLIGIGVDTDAKALRAARARVPSAAFLLSGGDRLPLHAGSVDGVLSECSLSLMVDRGRALAEWFRVLRRGGILALSDVYRREPDVVQEAAGIDRSPFVTREHLQADIEAAGFVIRRFEDCPRVLKSWVARFIFEYGSLEPLWGGACGLTAEAVRAATPGYFFMVAVKPNEWEGEQP